MPAEVYLKATNYEHFMCRAFKTRDINKPGIGLYNFRNLIDAENGESWVNHLPSKDKQLVKIKGYLEKAFDKLILRTKLQEKKEFLTLLREQVKLAYTSDDLLDIIKQGLANTNDLK